MATLAAEYHREWWAKNRDREVAKMKARYAQASPEIRAQRAAKQRARYQRDKDRLLKRATEYREAHREQIRASMRRYNRGKVTERRNALLAKYGLTPEDYELRLAAQGGGCAICHKPPKPHKRLMIDHDHVTGKVRGLLCSLCNHSLGAFGDTAEGVLAAYNYLRTR